MIRALHRRFLWNAFAIACIFLLVVIVVALGMLVNYVDERLSGALHSTLELAQTEPPMDGTRTRRPSYLIEIAQKEPDSDANALKEGDEAVFLRGNRSDFSEEEIASAVDEMLDAPVRIRTIREIRLCYLVDRSGGTIRIAAIDYEGYSTILNHIFLGGALLYVAIVVALFLYLKLAEIRLLRPAERAWANQERFVEDASHEMKTPLAVILSNAELGRSEQTEETDLRFSMILSEAQRMKLLITRMLETARIENNAAKHLNDTVFSLSDAVTECALMFEEPLYETGVALSYKVEDGMYVLADEMLLKQALRALLENAGKYTPKGNTVQVTAKRRYRSAVITVKNTGIGLDKREREAIFERFYRADKARTLEEGSYGLGLSITKNLVESMNGRIRCESDGETCTAFVLTLPLTQKK